MLGQRVAVAAVGIPIIFGLIWIGGWPFAIPVAIALAVAAAEFQHLRYRWHDPETIVSAALVAAITLAAHEGGGTRALVFVVAGGALAMLGALPRVNGEGAASGGRAALWIAAGTLYIGGLGCTAVLLRDFVAGPIDTIRALDDGSFVAVTHRVDNGRDWVLLALFGTYAADTAAYFTGRAIGRHKLAPSISPNKTWEGFAGGCAGGAAAVLALAYVLDVGIDVPIALLIAATLPIAAAAGDLFESWIKRRTGVKDASDLIPGHGGVLDRLDSLLFVFPLVWVVARWVA